MCVYGRSGRVSATHGKVKAAEWLANAELFFQLAHMGRVFT